VLISCALFLFPGAFNLDALDGILSAAVSAAELSAAEEPVQQMLDAAVAEEITLERDGAVWSMTPRADYRIAARVLHSKQYDDWQSSFVPVDLALGWGMFSEPHIDDWISWHQADRWYCYHYRRILSVPFPQNYVRNHSANVHVIPASDSLARVLRELQGNEVILLEGVLVDVEAHKDGTRLAFRTSLSRSDEGEASCEIMYVERLVVADVEYR
jgi:hypothetical protein